MRSSSSTLSVSDCVVDIVAIVSSEHRVHTGDIVNMVVPLDKIHVFDAETGHSVAPDLAPLAAAIPPTPTAAAVS